MKTLAQGMALVLLAGLVGLPQTGTAGAQGAPPPPARPPSQQPSPRGPVSLSGQEAGGHPFALADERGRVVVLILLSRYTSKQAAPIQDTLGPLNQPGQVAVFSVLDLMGIPGMFQGYAKRKIVEGAKGSPMRFLVDDQGIWRRYFGAEPDRRVDIIVIDRRGMVRGHFIGKEELGTMLQLIRTLREEHTA